MDRDDLGSTKADWKFVVYHHPAFNVGAEHYREQHMRVLSPLHEELSVDLVLSGHEHTYQRTKPSKFLPRDVSKASLINRKDRRTAGEFRIDRRFDGKAITKPEGILYIITGAGGKYPYDSGYTKNSPSGLDPKILMLPMWIIFCLTAIRTHLFDVDSDVLLMRQLDECGQEIDHLQITKI